MSSIEIREIEVSSLLPYEFNPRKNAEAIEAVKNSIKSFGYLVPIVVDENNVIVAGHTRHAALQQLAEENPKEAGKWSVAPCVIAKDLTEEQTRAFRLIDNKTAEIAGWDFDLLANEIGALHQSGISFVEFGWSQEEIDCLTHVVQGDCLTTDEMNQPLDEGVTATKVEGVDPGGGRGHKLSVTRDGLSARITFGELAFFVLLDDYKVWLDEMMKINDYDPKAVIEDVAERLGLLGAKLKRDGSVRQGDVSPEAEEAFDEKEATEQVAN
jgi:ParB family transcriptional regulator, chromosome partitioning protein